MRHSTDVPRQACYLIESQIEFKLPLYVEICSGYKVVYVRCAWEVKGALSLFILQLNEQSLEA